MHRDLKPANVKITLEGRVKVLDFGLAKALASDDERDSRLSQSPTLLSSPTVAGVILGTAAYMSPEQARGKSVDKRADIFAFGCVLFEMLTGTQAFQGDTVSDTLAAVLKTNPEWSLLPAQTPRAIRDLLHRCLEKDPKLRLRDIGEARIAIDHARHGGEEAVPAPAVSAPPRKSRDLLWAAGAVVLAAAAFLGARALAPEPPALPLRKFSIDLPIQRGQVINEFSVALSPDGQQLAYVHDNRLWVRPLSSFDAHELAGTEGAEMPFWSPDGAQVGYVNGSELRRIATEGGKSQVICNVPGGFTGGRQACWTEDGRIVFTTGAGGIFEVNAVGGEVKEVVPLIEKTEQDYHEVSELPGGRGYLYVPHLTNAGTSKMVLYANGERKELLAVAGARLWQPRYSPSGHIVFRRTPTSSGIWALPFSLQTLSVTGEPFLVEAEAAEPCPASDGTLAFRHGGESGQYQLAWVDRSGRMLAPISDVGGRIGQPAISPDGKRVAAAVEEGDNLDVWVFDLDRGTRTRLTFDPGSDVRPTWTPDGSTVVYLNTARSAIMSRAADGTGVEQFQCRGYVPAMSPDGRFVVFEEDGVDTKSDILMRPFPVDTSIAAVSVVASMSSETSPVVSPDGQHVAYTSDESGRWEVYLARFPSGEGKWQVSTSGGTWPAWNRRGTRLYYQFNNMLYEVDVDARSGLSLGRPHTLFRADSLGINLNPTSNFDVADGDRFVVNHSAGDEKGRQMLRIRVVQNWFEEFTENQASARKD